MASLYEINQSILNCVEVEQSILNCVEVEPGTTVNMETGEVIDLEKLSLLKMERSEKIRNIALWVKNLKADAMALTEEKAAFYKRQKAAETKAAPLESYLANVLDGEKVKGTEFSIGWRKSKAVTITDETKLPETFLIAQPPKVDKTAIRNALTCGEDVPGAELIENMNIQIK